jgi:ribosome-associated protein
MDAPLIVDRHFTIPPQELQISFARSSGPGGQNVNKVNSKVMVRWSPAESASLPDEIRARLLARLASRLTRTGELIVVSQRFRDAGRNTSDALEKLRELLVAALHQPRYRKPSRPTRGSVRRRRESKQRTSQRKQGRQYRDTD